MIARSPARDRIAPRCCSTRPWSTPRLSARFPHAVRRPRAGTRSRLVDPCPRSSRAARGPACSRRRNSRADRALACCLINARRRGIRDAAAAARRRQARHAAPGALLATRALTRPPPRVGRSRRCARGRGVVGWRSPEAMDAFQSFLTLRPPDFSRFDRPSETATRILNEPRAGSTLRSVGRRDCGRRVLGPVFGAWRGPGHQPPLARPRGGGGEAGRDVQSGSPRNSLALPTRRFYRRRRLTRPARSPGSRGRCASGR